MIIKNLILNEQEKKNALVIERINLLMILL